MEQPNFSLAGQVAIVSGASRGIGHDLVLALARAGAVVAAGVRSIDDATDLVAQVADRDGRAMAIELDVTDQGSIQRGVARVLADEGKIDILVNNAGLGANHDALDITEADWDEMMDVNLKGLLFLTQAVARSMVERGHGRGHQSQLAGRTGGDSAPRDLLSEQGRREHVDAGAGAGMGSARRHRKRHRSDLCPHPRYRGTSGRPRLCC